MLDREIVVVTLIGLPPIWDIFITTIRNNNVLLTFDEIVGNITQEYLGMIAGGRIQKHEEGVPIACISHDKRKKEKGVQSRKPPSHNSKGRYDKSLSHIDFFNCHKIGHYSCDYPERNKRHHYNTRYKFNNKRRNDHQKKNHDRRY